MSSAGERQRITKLPVDSGRIRHMPPQFAPIDRRLVYDRYICRLTHQQLALYFFLQCVGDAAGLSYYSDDRICQYLNFNGSELREARQGLIQGQFVLYGKPIYQLLDLPKPPSIPAKPHSSCHLQEAHRHRAVRESVPIATVVSELCAGKFTL